MAGEIETALAFVETINSGDVDGLAELMAEDIGFTDSGGTVEQGREAQRIGWRGYLDMFPDFRIVIDDVLQQGTTIGLFGSWTATDRGKRGLRPENRVGGPAAWRAEIDAGKVKRWQVYADHTETVKVMEAD